MENFIEMISIPFIYFVLNVLYSFGLKKIPLLDVSILMLGYLLRLIYGGVLGESGVSTWMFLTMMSAAFFCGFGKRRGELKAYGSENRDSLEKYSGAFLDQGILASCVMTIVFYAISCTDIDSVVAKSGVDMLWSVPGGTDGFQISYACTE